MPKDYELLLLTATIEAGRTCMLRGTVSMCDVNLVDEIAIGGTLNVPAAVERRTSVTVKRLLGRTVTLEMRSPAYSGVPAAPTATRYS